jgi:hypothetical protein
METANLRDHLPTEASSRMRKPASSTLDLPPPFRLVRLRESGDAFAHAKTIAAKEGAGALVYVGRFDVVEFAVVLEPDEPLGAARRAFYAGMVALRNALAASAPPQRAVGLAWPDAIDVDGGLIGGARLAWPTEADEEKPPAWLVFGAMLRSVAMGDKKGAPEKEAAPLPPLAASLEGEGFDESGSERLVESFARHLMAIIDAWQANGFGIVEQSYLTHLRREKNAWPTLGANGDLLLRWTGKREPDRYSLAHALAQPTWLDPDSRGPRG